MKTLKARALEKMLSYVGMVERTGDNDHPQFEKANRLLGVPEHAPYCATICMLAFLIAVCEKYGDDPTEEANLAKHKSNLHGLMPVSASTTALMVGARDRGTWLPAEEWQKAEPGDLVLFDFSFPGKPMARHTAMVRAKPNGTHVLTVEGNTGFDSEQNPTNDAKKGGGVWKKRRGMASRPGYKILGYVRTPA